MEYDSIDEMFIASHILADSSRVSTEELKQEEKAYRDGLNSVPPYSFQRRKKRKAWEKVLIAIAVITCLAYVAFIIYVMLT